MMLFGKKKDKLGICLSGGGALGYAHIGALQAFEEYNIYPQHVSGASVGALIGVLYAEGYKSSDILKLINEEKLFKISHLFRIKNVLTSEGLTDISKVEEVLHKRIPHNSFDKLKRRFYVSVADLYKPKSEIISTGNRLIESVIASASFPVFFEPKKYDSSVFVDGGVLNNFPVEPLLKNTRTVVGLDLLFPEPNVEIHSKMDIISRVYRIMSTEMQATRIKKCHHYIPIKGLTSYRIYDFDKLDELYRLGYLSVKDYLAKHKSLI
ncbi:MAG: patatin-like phospholipase family protein [Bacteroidales bacterium]|jgi:NTE family protein|nr:patatin-like phospholipase family protein [Bacteroidales bacterium]